AAESSGPRRIHMEGSTRSHHFHTPDLSLFYQKRFSKKNARRTVESIERIRPSVRQDAGVDRALINHAVRPHDAALLIDNGIAASVNALDDKVVAQLELRYAIHCEGVNRIRRLVRTRRRARRR